jgi:hypothetical protein
MAAKLIDRAAFPRLWHAPKGIADKRNGLRGKQPVVEDDPTQGDRT